MKEQLMPCSSVAVMDTLLAVTGGAIWGGCIGPRNASKQGLTGTARAFFLAKSVGKHGFICGATVGAYSATRCGIQRYRGKNDLHPSQRARLGASVKLPYFILRRVMNALIAGAVAGAAVAAGAGSRSWIQVAGAAALFSAISTASDYSKMKVLKRVLNRLLEAVLKIEMKRVQLLP
ncbi:hypothetical protein Tsubulata_021551 [Turnera subulata]|uniref:Uncharacterized protein n=1 Tax=Turnera subulata TaxID=218843 RepID=A0A9Q0GIL4_9ROSI|nr:hypothetical protein Tsubulata_021551 [Turnera subulata]